MGVLQRRWEFSQYVWECESLCGALCLSSRPSPLETHFFERGRAIALEVLDCNAQGGVVRSNLGTPQWLEDLALEGEIWHWLDTGVPHLVHFVQEPSQIPTHKTPQMQALRARFNANVNIACIVDLHTIRLATYERGVEDITLACGTGMAAVFVCAHRYHNTPPQATLIPPSAQSLDLCLQENEVYFKGEVHFVGAVSNPPRIG